MVLWRFGFVGVLLAEGSFSYIDSDIKEASMAWSSVSSKSTSAFKASASSSCSWASSSRFSTSSTYKSQYASRYIDIETHCHALPELLLAPALLTSLERFSACYSDLRSCCLFRGSRYWPCSFEYPSFLVGDSRRFSLFSVSLETVAHLRLTCLPRVISSLLRFVSGAFCLPDWYREAWLGSLGIKSMYFHRLEYSSKVRQVNRSGRGTVSPR